MLAFIEAAEGQLRLERLARGRPPRIPDRARFLNRLSMHSPMEQIHQDAFVAIDTLLELGWQPMNTAERRRKERASPLNVESRADKAKAQAQLERWGGFDKRWDEHAITEEIERREKFRDVLCQHRDSYEAEIALRSAT